jgi:solute:Na+ symporter, SSS family
MNYPVFFALVVFILAASLYIGKKSSVGIKSQKDYFLSGRSLSLFKVAMTILATQLGGGAIMGAAEAAYHHGWIAISYSLGLAIGLIILSLGVGAKFRRMNISTIPEIFKKVYDSEFLRLFSSSLYVISMFFILVATGVSARKFSLAIGYHNDITFIIFWLIIIAYTTTGGLSAVTRTDILQVIFVLVAFVLTFLSLASSDIVYSVNAPSVDMKNVPWMSWLIFPCLFAITGQDMAQRCFAAESPKAISRATAWAAIFLLIASLLPAYLGVIAYKSGFESVGNSSVLINIVNKLTNPYITSIFACAILMAILSTADSLLCAISSNVALDFFPMIRGKSMKSTNVAKAITVVIGLSAMLFSFFAETIIPIMVIAYELSMCSLFVPVIMAVTRKNPPTKMAAYLSSFSGIFAFIVLSLFSQFQYKAIMALVISLFAFLVTESLKSCSQKILK